MNPATGDNERYQGDGKCRQFRGWGAPAALAVAVRPQLWGVAVRQCLRLAVPGMVATVAPLPVPDADYLRFRLQTAFGDREEGPAPADVVAYLHWCRRFPT